MDEIERTLLVKPEVLVYKIGPRPSAKGFRASDWNLAAPDWTGRLRVLAKGSKCNIKLEDKNSGQLFAECPVEQYPGTSVEAVTDSSRYFVICIQDSGRKAYIGMGFADRADSFDLNVALQDHFKQIRKEDDGFGANSSSNVPKLDLGFKDGQTIRVSIPNSNKDGGTARPKTRPAGGGALGGIPPPPGGVRIGPPPSAANLTPMQSPLTESAPSLMQQPQPVNNSNNGPAASSSSNSSALADLLDDFGTTPSSSSSNTNPPVMASNSAIPSSNSGDDLWGDFASAASATDQSKSSGNWVQF